MASLREPKDPMASIQELRQFLNNMHVIDLSPVLYTDMPHWQTYRGTGGAKRCLLMPRYLV